MRSIDRQNCFVSGISQAAALGGVLLAARLDAAPPSTLGSGFELNVLTAVLLGGVAFSGGRGSMLGVILGVLFLGVLTDGMTLAASELPSSEDLDPYPATDTPTPGTPSNAMSRQRFPPT